MDVETTDVDPHRSRLVSAAVVMIGPTAPGRRREVKTWQWLADPEVEIPVEATAIHGISTETARRDGAPQPKSLARWLRYWGRCGRLSSRCVYITRPLI
nr:exonuclease domain-containing protein [Saccharomonospora sp. CUA-673]